jgi:carbon storage regulator
MLVLTRQIGEKLVIGNEVVIEVLSVSGECVRLGITAPRETSVHRFEVFEEIQAANRAAATPSVSAPRAAIKGLAARLRPREESEEANKEQGERRE